METPSWLYKEYTLGNITSNSLNETEKLASGLTAGAGALMIGTALASPVLAAAGAKGAEKMMDSIDRMTFDRDLKKVLSVNPDIGKPNDKQIRLAYQSIRTTNPKFSKDPLIAGTLLRQIMQNKVNPYDPKSPARVDLNIASQLSSSRGRDASEFVLGAAAQSMGNLPTNMLQAHNDLQSAAEQKEEADRRFAMSQAQFIQKEDHFNRKNKTEKLKMLQTEFDKDTGFEQERVDHYDSHGKIRTSTYKRKVKKRGGKTYGHLKHNIRHSKRASGSVRNRLNRILR